MGHRLIRHWTATVGTTAGQLLPGATGRQTLLISAPPARPALWRPNAVVADDSDTSGVGTLLTYTAPTGRRSRVRYIALTIGSGNPTVELRVTRGGTTVVLRTDTASYEASVDIALDAGDTVQLVVTAGGGIGSQCDAIISGYDEEPVNTVTLSFRGDPTAGQGIVIYPGQGPVQLTKHDYG